MFKPLPARFDFPAAEKRVLEFWERAGVFAQSIELRRGSPRFVFYEGPPTANGMPHPGHCLTRAMKDIFPRYKTMCGFLVERKAGWDTHGLPVEREVCKELGIRTKQEIEAYGVEKFNLKCIQSVFRYTREWEELTRRLGFWVNLQDAYVTYHQSYVESVWWSLKTLFDRDVLYQGHKIVWWWAQGGTALSSGEVGEGYRKVDDPSVFVKFPLVQGTGDGELGTGPGGDGRTIDIPDRTSLLVWTTTPWTLISNHFAAVHPELEYALVHDPVDDEHLYIAAALVETIAKKVKRELRIVSVCSGEQLLGLRYLPPFDCYSNEHGSIPVGQAVPRGRLSSLAAWLDYGVRAWDAKYWLKSGGGDCMGWRVLAADFVTIESGTGLVHEAPAFGEVDFNLLQKERERFVDPNSIPVLCAVNPDGTFNDDAPERYRGRWVKDCDKEIIRELRDERMTPWGTPLLYHQEQYHHDYPFCPQAPDDPLIQYARRSWFVRTSQVKDEFLKNNAAINWLPEHIKEGRFGNFLRENVDWALSRERYWGTPLPIWRCERCGRMEAVGSFAELQAKSGATDGGYWERKVAEHRGEEFPEHLRVHKPYIDEWTYECAACAGAASGKQPIGLGTEGRRNRGSEDEGQEGARAARMRRVPEVIDCWWDAGSMPFAQWGFPHAPGSRELVRERWPADFISEAQDQTRGWFYGLLAISTLLRGDLEKSAEREASYPVPYRNVICLGLIAGEDGEKMSKKLRNYKEPTYIFDSYGADAMRWYFFSAQAPWTSVRFQEAAIRDSQREFLVKLYNVLSFFTIYASIDGFDPRLVDDAKFCPPDGFDPAAGASVPPPQARPMNWRPSGERTELDRWIITELRRTIGQVRASMDQFENYPAAQHLNSFVDALSNWYVRRSRDRFWRPSGGATGERGGEAAAAFLTRASSALEQEKWDAYHTLYGCLRVLSRLIAPFTPFFAEEMHQVLRIPSDPVSVHLCDYPKPEDVRYFDEGLAATMDTVRELVALGRAARTSAKLKVRQPLSLVEIILAPAIDADAVLSHATLIAEELNVQRVELASEADKYVTYKVVPNFKAIGAKFRDLVPKIKETLGKLADPAGAKRVLSETGALPLEIEGRSVPLTAEEVEIRVEARPGWSAAQGRAGVVVLNTTVTPELRDEGVVRELIHFVQAARKEQNLAYQARVALTIDAPPAFLNIVRRFEHELRSECLAEQIEYGPAESVEPVDVEGHAVRLSIRVLR